MLCHIFILCLIAFPVGKGKVAAKSSGLRYQWQIMQLLGLQNEQIRLFANPYHWLEYFPALAYEDLRSMGLKVCRTNSSNMC